MREYAFLVLTLAVCIFTAEADAAQWHVAAGGTGDGSAGAPFGRIQEAIDAARPGDVVVVGPGTFRESLRTVRAGTASRRIIIRSANGRGSTLVTARGRVVSIAHGYITIDALVIDGQYGASDLVRVAASATGLIIRDTEVRRSGRDAIDMGAVHDVLIEDSLIHHALNAAKGRTDAHGIVATSVRRLTVRNTEIHTFSGDAIQLDPSRSAPGWSDVTIEGCRMWLGPLASSENGFPAGTVPGENALDTKAGAAHPRARLTIRNTEAWGFKDGLISNMVAFNLKENVDVTLDGVTVRDSEIAFRLRGPAAVRIQNAVVYAVARAVRYEDDIQNARIWNSTFGRGVERAFQGASAVSSGLDVRNVLVLGSKLPAEASHDSNRAVGASAFANAAAHDYRLAAGSPAIDTGVTIEEVSADRVLISRPQGGAYDVGAYERLAAESSTPGRR